VTWGLESDDGSTLSIGGAPSVSIDDGGAHAFGLNSRFCRWWPQNNALWGSLAADIRLRAYVLRMTAAISV